MADIEKIDPNKEIEHARSKSQITLEAEPLVQQLRELIENTRKRVASVVSDETSQLYWNVGNAINTFVLQGNRAEYGKQIVVTVSRQLAEEYGSGFEEKNVRRMMQFATEYQDFEIVATLIRQLTWTHFIALIPIREPLKRAFYEQMAITEHWSVRTLRKKIDSQLYERTAISRQPEETIKHDLTLLREENKMTPNLVFRDPYLLNLFGLKDTYSENNIENQKYMLNAYRVLLTRARQGIVICVPAGNDRITPEGFPEDATRLPEFYNGTYKYLKSLGLKEI